MSKQQNFEDIVLAPFGGKKINKSFNTKIDYVPKSKPINIPNMRKNDDGNDIILRYCASKLSFPLGIIDHGVINIDSVYKNKNINGPYWYTIQKTFEIETRCRKIETYLINGKFDNFPQNYKEYKSFFDDEKYSEFDTDTEDSNSSNPKIDEGDSIEFSEEYIEPDVVYNSDEDDGQEFYDPKRSSDVF